jgi:hypothetical protein
MCMAARKNFIYFPFPSFVFKMALRSDTRRDPRPKGVGSECTSSRWTQIAKQNRTAGEPEGRGR